MYNVQTCYNMASPIKIYTYVHIIEDFPFRLILFKKIKDFQYPNLNKIILTVS